MLLKILKQFHDRETNELYKVGAVIDVREERAKEILNSPLNVAELVETEQETEQETKGKGGRGRKKKEDVE